MARIGLLTLYATGHLNPSLTLARALKRHGHEVVFFNLPDVAAQIEAGGCRAVVYGAEEYPAGSLATSMQKTAELSGPAAFAHYVQRMVTLFRAAFRDLPDRLRGEALDLLIVDQVYYAGATLAEHLGVPFVSLANALLVNREDVIPPPVMLWPFDSSAAGIERNRKGWAGVDQAYAHLLPVVKEQRSAWGLPAYTNLLEDSFSPLLQICQQPPVFEFPRPQAPPSLHLVGHLQDDAPGDDESFQWDWLDGRPLLYASCGTLQNRLEHVFRAIIDACATMDVQAVVALGRDGLAPASFGEVPDNVLLVPYAPQRHLLARATVCITHAGLNTTLDCLEAAVPMVAIPLASEQPGIAMRIAHLGAGVVLPLAEVAAATVAAAVETVRREPAYREAATAAAREIARLAPAETAVALLEDVLRANRA